MVSADFGVATAIVSGCRADCQISRRQVIYGLCSDTPLRCFNRFIGIDHPLPSYCSIVPTSNEPADLSEVQANWTPVWPLVEFGERQGSLFSSAPHSPPRRAADAPEAASVPTPLVRVREDWEVVLGRTEGRTGGGTGVSPVSSAGRG